MSTELFAILGMLLIGLIGVGLILIGKRKGGKNHWRL